jgi:hypothetical protein
VHTLNIASKEFCGPRLVVDRRIGGVPQYSVAFDDNGSDSLFQVPPEFLKCVAFLCTKTKGKLRWEATAFFVSVNYQNGLEQHLYAVTAKHVIDGIREDGHKKVHFRLNFSNKPADFMKSAISDWWFHPTDAASDIAVLPVILPDDSDHLNLPAGVFFIRPELANYKRLDVGDQVFYTGLFWERPGAKKNLPIVRIGTIAAMPGEPIEMDEGPPMIGYLMEARSMGGLSGSPVFIDLGGTRILESGDIQGLASPEYYLIGIACAHWDVVKPEKPGQDANMGIAIVTPASKLTETLNRPELQAMRDKKERDSKKAHFPKKDRVSQEITKKEFEEALLKTSRKFKPKPSSESGQEKP